MKNLAILPFLIALQFRHGLLAKLEPKENGTEVDQQRSARVHRISIDESIKQENTPNEESSKLPFGNQKILQTFSEKLQSALPDLSELIQQEAQLFRELNVILKDLPRDEAMRLKDRDQEIDNNRLDNNPEELDIYRQAGQDTEKRVKLRSPFSMNDVELKAIKNVTQYLDNVFMEIQNHIAYIRNVFEKLCRKHRSRLNIEKSTNQPKRISIL